MEQMNNRARPSAKMRLGGILMRVALILLCLVLLSIHMMGSLFARYASNGSGIDEARVAKFEVVVDGSDDVTVDALTTSNGTYAITVQNNSEVSVKYDMTVTLSKTVPGVSAQIDGKGGTQADTVWTFTDVGSQAPNATNATTHNLTFLVDWADFTENVTGSTASANFTFTVTIHVVQVD